MAKLGLCGRVFLIVAVLILIADELDARGGRGGSRGGSRGGRARFRSSRYGGRTSAGVAAGATVGIIFGVIGGVVGLVVLIVIIKICCCRSSNNSSSGAVLSPEPTPNPFNGELKTTPYAVQPPAYDTVVPDKKYGVPEDNAAYSQDNLTGGPDGFYPPCPPPAYEGSAWASAPHALHAPGQDGAPAGPPGPIGFESAAQ